MIELCFNLWYYLGRDQTIRAISARTYLLEGDEEVKGQVLAVLSVHDWKLVPARPLPDRLLEQYSGEVRYSVVTEVGIEEVYRDLFRELRDSSPDQMPFPDDKLFFATPLFDFGAGFVPAIVGDGYIKERYSYK